MVVRIAGSDDIKVGRFTGHDINWQRVRFQSENRFVSWYVRGFFLFGLGIEMGSFGIFPRTRVFGASPGHKSGSALR